MQHLLTIAGINVLVDIPYQLYPSESTTDFIHTLTEPVSYDLRFEVFPVKKLSLCTDVRYIEARRVYIGEGDHAGTYFSSFPNTAPYAFVTREKIQSGVLQCEYIPGNEKYMNYSRNIITLLDIEATLLDFDALILHSSLICWNGAGIIFAAPSGTGKSTQAALWERFLGADILNGDRAAIRKKGGIWHAFGLPYAGTSGIYRNESVPLKAFVALQQAKENSIRKITGAEAFRYLYPETMIHRWDSEFESRASDLLLTMIRDIPVFLLACRPDREAVEILKKEMQSLMREETLS